MAFVTNQFTIFHRNFSAIYAHNTNNAACNHPALHTHVHKLGTHARTAWRDNQTIQKKKNPNPKPKPNKYSIAYFVGKHSFVESGPHSFVSIILILAWISVLVSFCFSYGIWQFCFSYVAIKRVAIVKRWAFTVCIFTYRIFIYINKNVMHGKKPTTTAIGRPFLFATTKADVFRFKFHFHWIDLDE